MVRSQTDGISYQLSFPFLSPAHARRKGKKKVEIGDVTCGRMLTWPPDRREEREETGGQKSTVVSQVTHQPQDDLESEEQLTVDLLLRVLLSTVNSCSTFQSCGWWCTKGKGKVNRCPGPCWDLSLFSSISAVLGLARDTFPSFRSFLPFLFRETLERERKEERERSSWS